MRILSCVFALFFLYFSTGGMASASSNDQEFQLQKQLYLFEQIQALLKQRAFVSTEMHDQILDLPSGEKIDLASPAFFELVDRAAELFFLGFSSSGQDASTLLKTSQRLRQETIRKNFLLWGKLLGWIYQQKEERGLDWVVVTLAFEIVEHGTMWFIPPSLGFCELFQLFYLSTSGLGWRLHYFSKSQVSGKRISISKVIRYPYFLWLYRKRSHVFLSKTKDGATTLDFNEQKAYWHDKLKRLDEVHQKILSWLDDFNLFESRAPHENNYLTLRSEFKFLRERLGEIERSLAKLKDLDFPENYLAKKADLFRQMRGFNLFESRIIEQLSATLELKRDEIQWTKEWLSNKDFWHFFYDKDRNHKMVLGLEDVLLANNPLDRFQAAQQLLALFEIQKETIAGLLYTGFKNGHFDRLTYFKFKEVLGRLGGVMQWKFRAGLEVLALQEKSLSLATPSFKRLKLGLGHLVRSFEIFPESLQMGYPTESLLEQVSTLEKQMAEAHRGQEEESLSCADAF